MSPHSQGAFVLSLTLHALVAALVLFFGYFSRTTDEPSRVLELVAGEGDNYMATEAAALGTEGGVKLPTPKPPAPVEAVPQPPAPVAPTAPTTPTTPAEKPVPDLSRTVKRAVANADAKAKREIAKEAAAEKKRDEEEKKKQQQAAKLTKEEFDRRNKTKSTTAPTKVASNTKAPKGVDAEGIAKGVVGGSTANKIGGAGGKALTANPDDVLAAYYALFKTRLHAAFEPPPGLSDTLKATIEFRSNPDGSITNARITKSSGSAEYDRAVLDAVARVKMPPRPDKKAEEPSIIFSMRERE